MAYARYLRAMVQASCALTLPWAAHAQTAPGTGGDTQTSAASADNAFSGDIVVTAQRRAEPLSKVPASVAAYSQERLDVLGVRDFGDIASLTPGVRIREPQNQIAIRGLASNAGAATTGVYIDDTPIQVRTFGEGAAAALPYVFDLDRVEVLRGPQGTLFGAGSLGGTVRYITPEPSLEKTSVYSRVEGGVIQDGGTNYEGGVALGIPVVQDLAGLRVTGAYRHRGGWVDRVDYQTKDLIDKDANSESYALLRAVAKIEPAPGLVFLPSITWQRRKVDDTDQYFEALSDPSKGRYINANAVALPDTDRYFLYNLTTRYEASKFSVIATTSFFNRKQRRFYDGSLYTLTGYEYPAGTLVIDTGENVPYLQSIGVDRFVSVGQIDNAQHNFTQEVRIQSSDSDARFQWVLGGFYGNNRQRNIESLFEPDLPALFQGLYGLSVEDTLGGSLGPNAESYVGNQLQRERQLAGFANASFAITPKLRAQAGVRVSRAKFDYRTDFSGAYYTAPYFVVGKTSETPITPRFAVNYQATADTLVYASAAKGYRIGGVNAPLGGSCQALLAGAGRPIPPAGFGSDNAWSYELGAKTKMGRTLRVEASAFHIDWSNIQQRVTLDPCSVTYTLNLGKAKSDGFDLSLSYQPMRALTFDVAIGYDDARYTKTVYLTNVSTSGPIRVAKGEAIGSAGSPWQASVGARYDFAIASHDGFIRANYEFNSRNTRNVSTTDPATISFNPVLYDRPTTHFVRVRAGTTFGNLEAQLFADNLLDSRKPLGNSNYAQYSPLYINSTFQPRTVGVTLIYRQ